MISELLNKGAENATLGSDLCQMLGLTPRELRKCVEIERRDGIPICSGANGYFMPEYQEELKEFCNLMWLHIKALTETRSACLEHMGELPSKRLEALE